MKELLTYLMLLLSGAAIAFLITSLIYMRKYDAMLDVFANFVNLRRNAKDSDDYHRGAHDSFDYYFEAFTRIYGGEKPE